MAKQKTTSDESNQPRLLDLLKYRFSLAEAFTKDYIEEVKRSLDDYELKETEQELLEKITNVNKRYEFKIPYIFATHESMLSTMFDRNPDLVFRGRGLSDKNKQQIVQATWDYLEDVCNVAQFRTATAWWFLLTGNCTGHTAFKSVAEDLPLLDDNGSPMMEGEDPLNRKSYIYNDPILWSGDPLNEFYSPESQFSDKGDKIPYFFRKEEMELAEIKEIYGIDVEPTSKLKVADEKKENDDVKRCTVYFYDGDIPEKYADEVDDWSATGDYKIVYVIKEGVLHIERQDERGFRQGKWYGSPTTLLGFGIAKTLRDSQKEMSIRRGQEVRYADLMAFPKLAHDMTDEIDEKAALDPRVGLNIGYKNKPPVWVSPPPMPETIVIAEQKAREDAQFISGLLDLSKGGQNSSVVDTAYGQSMFAEAAEKRSSQAKRQYGRFYREIVIMLLKLAQRYWDDDKVLSITDDQGNQNEITVNKNDLKDIDFDRDIDIEMESVSVNKDVLRAQAIGLYDKIKDDPLVDRKAVFMKMLRDGFDEKNPEAYLAPESVQGVADPNNPMASGQPPINPNPAMGMAQPTGTDIPSSQSQILGQQ